MLEVVREEANNKNNHLKNIIARSFIVNLHFAFPFLDFFVYLITLLIFE